MSSQPVGMLRESRPPQSGDIQAEGPQGSSWVGTEPSSRRPNPVYMRWSRLLADQSFDAQVTCSPALYTTSAAGTRRRRRPSRGLAKNPAASGSTGAKTPFTSRNPADSWPSGQV